MRCIGNKNMFCIFILISMLILSSNVLADYYAVDLGFTTSSSVYSIGDRIEIKGSISKSSFYDNGTIISNNTAVNNSSVTLSIINSSNSTIANYSLNTSSIGQFYTRSDSQSTAVLVSAPSTSGTYDIKLNYTDNNNTNWTSQIEISILNETVDELRVSTDKVVYDTSEPLIVEVEAVRKVGDRLTYVANVSVTGNIRDSSKSIVSSFSCNTTSAGSCMVSTTAPTSYGEYLVEINEYKAFSSFRVRPFKVNIYMTDNLGQTIKHTYSTGDQAGVQIEVLTNSTTETYTFDGVIKDKNGNTITEVNTSSLSFNNSYRNQFVFTLNALNYSYGDYFVYINVTKTSEGIVSASTSFQVKNWDIVFKKRETDSGFQYSYSSFGNKSGKFEIYPTWRANGSIIKNINISSFNVTLKDTLGDLISSSNVTWNDTCGSEGCYEFNLTTPTNVGQYTLEVLLSYEGNTVKQKRIINVINSYISAQTTNQEGEIKELFGLNEFIFLSLNKIDSNKTIVNISSVNSILVTYMNGTEISFTKKDLLSEVNATNSVNEWAFNNTSQKLKLDVPSMGGVYSIIVNAENNTLIASTRFIVNPYDLCVSAKDTASQVTSGFYYSYQFKTTDTVYFEIKVKQANNPTGRATSLNVSSNSSNATGLGSACRVDTSQDQVVNNASISVEEVRNVRTGKIISLNTTTTTCNADDNQGGYTCTVQPYNKWDSGSYSVKLKVTSLDGNTKDIVYGNFEARAFYLYAYSSTYQNEPGSNIVLTVNMYEAGNNWWSNIGSGGLSGTVSVEKIEYQGRDGEWLWPPIDYAYNVSNVNDSTVTNGQGTITLPASNAPGGVWKTGYYRAILKGIDNGGTTDYGYAWFGIRLFDVFASPVECSGSTCNSKYYVNSKENVSLYVRISKAGQYNAGGGVALGGNVIISVKKLQDCRKWPCTDLNSSQYNVTSINISNSSPHYWNTPDTRYIINITPLANGGRWQSGYYSVVLDVNGTDTGQGWFNAIAFYAETRPTDSTGANWKYNIKGNETRHFNITTVKSQKSGWYYTSYSSADFINTTITAGTLRLWDSVTYQNIEYSYPTSFNITPTKINGSRVVNLTYNNGSWPSGYYWGELTLVDDENQTNNANIWFQVQPFRVEPTSNQYTVDDDGCINGTIKIYDPDWYANTILEGNYSITSMTERIWSGSGSTLVTYTNYSPSSSFNGSANLSICPNNAQWPSSSYGGYHYLTIMVKDNSNNDTKDGWLSFRALPFSATFGAISGGTNKLTGENIVVPITLTKPISGANSIGNLSRLYQWRYDTFSSTYETYNFSIGDCSSTTLSSCMINGTQNVTITPPSTGWKEGYNYITADFTKSNDAAYKVTSYSGIWFYGTSAYTGWFQNYNSSGSWVYYFSFDDNLTIRVQVRDTNNNVATVNITNVQYSSPSSSCWEEYCRTYTDATWQLVNGGGKGNETSNGVANILIRNTGTNWSRGNYYFKVSVSGNNGTGTIKNGNVYLKDFTAPVVNITSPINRQNLTNASLSITATTTEPATCWINILNFGIYYSWHCGGIGNNTNNTTSEPNLALSCNNTIYSGNSYYYSYISNNYYNYYANSSYTGWSSGSTGLTTGGTTHTYTATLANLPDQDYGVFVSCNDEDWNYAKDGVSIQLNVTGGNTG